MIYKTAGKHVIWIQCANIHVKLCILFLVLSFCPT